MYIYIYVIYIYIYICNIYGSDYYHFTVNITFFCYFHCGRVATSDVMI